MKASVSLILVLILSLATYHPGRGQTTPPQQQDEIVRVRTNEVKLDVVVKDKKGRPVKDLTASDFEVYEDGTRQQVDSFRFVMRESTGGNSPEGKADRREETPQGPQRGPIGPSTSTPGIIALVFDRLSLDARTLARKAGMAYAKEGMSGGDFTGVFGIDQSLQTYQSFTDNPEFVRQAIDRVTGAGSSTYASSAAKIRDLSDRSSGLDREVSSSQSAASAAGAARDSAGAAAAGQASGQAAAEQKFIEMETNILEQYEVLERDQQGFATINALLAVINPMRNLPGRKTIIFFSEGLALPSSVQAKFPAVISAANRANVSIYTIDSAGLRIESGLSEAAREINTLAAKRMQQVSRGNDRGSSGPYTKDLERNEDLLRLDPRSGLGQLANETGGFLIHDTNDLASGIRRINDDMRGYYLITYTPKNNDYNGRFRQIGLKMSRPNLEVQTRKGYYAVDSVGQLPVLDYEAPALAAAKNAQPSSNPFPFLGAALSFPALNRSGLMVVLGEAPISAFTFSPSNDKKTYNADISIIALVRDQSDRVVQKLSQHYPFSGPIENLESAKKGDLLFYRETQLPAGSYKVELVAFDGLTGKIAVRSSQLEIPSGNEASPRLSSVTVLKRVERLTPEEQKRDQPLHFGELLIYPNLGEPLLKSVAKQLAFYFTVWPAKGSTVPLKCTVEILQNNHHLAELPAQLPAADEQGRTNYVSTFPLDKFKPGIYDIRVTIIDGKDTVSRATQFTVAP